MKTDIREKDDQYELAVDLPGFKKMKLTLMSKTGILPSVPRRVSTKMKKIKKDVF